jgi:hypothetical protein
MNGYGIFGAEIKEPPQMTSARAMLGVGRNASADEIQKQYRQLSMRWHPDRHLGKPTEQEAGSRFKLYSSAYGLLSKAGRQVEANQEFQKALEEPFVVGDRVFCLGSLYGTRIFIPKNGKGPRITDSSRLLSGSSSQFVESYSEAQHKKYFGIRTSIMESAFADTLEMFYGGRPNGPENEGLLLDGFVNKSKGGLDDLVWIRNNELGVHDFLNRDFGKSADKFARINSQVAGNIIFMFRYGVCLEAMAAEPKFKQNNPGAWQQNMGRALKLYDLCIQKLQARHYSYPDESNDSKGWHDPNSKLTVMMQAADAYEYVGQKDMARKLWIKIRKIDPDCYEAQVKGSNLAIRLPYARGLLSFMSGRN